MIIFGTKTTKKLLESGDFHCPQCQQTTSFEKRRAKNWFHLYFIPLIPLKEYPPYVECRQCRNTYIARVLDDEPGRDIAAEFERAAGLIMAKMVLADGEIDDSEIETMREVYGRITGTTVEREVILKLIESAKGESATAEQIAADFGTRLNADGQELVMKAILLIALSDGDFAQEEQDMANAIGKALGMSSAHMKGIFAELTES